jgi:uroporphyrinogen-III decarboxylase
MLNEKWRLFFDMNPKQQVIDAICGKTTDIPVTIHGWGLYKFKLAGVITGYEDQDTAWALNGEALAEVEAALYERFKPDTFHLGSGMPARSGDPKKERYIESLAEEVKKLESTAVIDEYIKAVYQTEEEVLSSRIYDHVSIISRRYGGTVFITLNEGNPFAAILDPQGLLGFEDGLINLIEKGEMAAYLLHHLYDIHLERMKALKTCGADGYIGSETYCSADLISPAIYHDIVFPAQRHFYTKLKELGLYSMCYFTGDIFPMLEDIKNLGIDALLTEARNKAVEIDIGELYKKTSGAFTLYGNLNSVEILQKGGIDAVREETKRQISVCDKGKFVMTNDCPVSFGTPEENIHAMLSTVKSTRPKQ